MRNSNHSLEIKLIFLLSMLFTISLSVFDNCLLKTNNEGLLLDCTFSCLTGIPRWQLKNITDIDLSQNNISSLESNTFNSACFSTIQTLNLSYNSILFMSSLTFLPFHGGLLETLDLSHNQIEYLPELLPPSLKELRLSYNHLKSFFLPDIQSLFCLKFLSLDSNFIQSITRLNKFPSCQANEALYLKRTKFKYHTRKIELKLKFLNLEHNLLSDLDSLEFLSSLSHLFLSHNNLTRVHVKTFKNFYALKYLDLSVNKISYVEVGTFANCRTLEFLSLSENLLKSFPEDLPMLEWLDVSHNQLERLSENLKFSLYPVEVFLLGNNPLCCDCTLMWLKELYDTREYQLRFLQVPVDSFIPACASPKNLENDTWDVLSSDVFICNGSEWKLYPIEKFQEETQFKFSVLDVGSTFVRVKWIRDTNIQALSISYRKFGHQQTTSVPLSPLSSQYTLRNLKPNQPYVMCATVIVIAGTKDHPLSQSYCLETTTTSITDGSFFQLIFSLILACAPYLATILLFALF